MGRDTLIQYIDDLIEKADSSEYRYDAEAILYDGLEELKEMLKKELDKEPKL